MELWLVAKLLQDNGTTMEVNGIYSSKDKAFAAISDDHSAAAVCFDLDRDYSEIRTFVAFSLAHPEGIATSTPEPLMLHSAPKPAPPRRDGAYVPMTQDMSAFGPPPHPRKD